MNYKAPTQHAIVLAFAKELLAKKNDLINAHQRVMETFTDKESQFAIETRANYERLLDEHEELLLIIGKVTV
jgi:hypothetical protein